MNQIYMPYQIRGINISKYESDLKEKDHESLYPPPIEVANSEIYILIELESSGQSDWDMWSKCFTKALDAKPYLPNHIKINADHINTIQINLDIEELSDHTNLITELVNETNKHFLKEMEAINNKIHAEEELKTQQGKQRKTKIKLAESINKQLTESNHSGLSTECEKKNTFNINLSGK